ncbi:MAG: UDP-N-acetylglucosamine-1-phosphate transferase [Thaumarchaeota archaeon]|nr:MAG: UDP-N-acetylglucosamine-1-phosphate transferase [Nitrososphaerota archaeon]TLX89555.1 MAG: UDP-N-acetylglucosamine-1-phosphate transferase [Nitrososphaerota archaeon]
MIYPLDITIYGIIVSAISFSIVFFITPAFIEYLTRKGRVVVDYHKPGKLMVPRPAGPVLLIGVVISEIILYFLILDVKIISVLLTTIIAFIIGYIDDLKTMPGWFKPAALILAAIPIIVLGTHGNYLGLIFDSAFIPILYILLILSIIPIVGNTINSIDVFNGVASGFIIITMIPLLVSVILFSNTNVFLIGLPLLFGCIAIYQYHKFPSKIFLGDSGTLLLGSMYAGISIVGNSEIIGVIALLPAVMNSFLFLSSVKKIVEHREVKTRPVTICDDFRLMASKDNSAPATLVRLILARGPLSEQEIITRIFILATFSSILAIISIGIQYAFMIGKLSL